jgi:GNAT superfamily N-acetyltransferase
MDCALASERSYFRLAAEEHSGEHLLFAVVPGLESLPAASVCILDAEKLNMNELSQAIKEGEEAFARAGAHTARFYIGETDKNFSAFMEGRSYRRRTEIVHAVAPLPIDQDDPSGAHWRKISCEEDWAEKAAIHTPPSLASDGYASHPSLWLSLERHKAATGKIDFWIYALAGPANGRAVATTGLMRCGDGILRIKNFFVQSDCRGKGIGKLALRCLLRQLKSTDENAAVLLSIEGSVGERLYRSVGARDIGHIYEWSRES